MWDLPGPGIEPVFPALAGRFLITVPPGKCRDQLFIATIMQTTIKLQWYIISTGGVYEWSQLGDWLLLIFFWALLACLEVG